MKNKGDFSNPQEALDRMASEAAGPTDAGSFEPTAPDELQEPQVCRTCGRGPARIESYMYVMSFAIFSRWSEYPDLLCRDCSTKTALREQVKSALLGWWGIPWGLLTFKALWVNGRTLARWSRIAAVPAVALSLLALAVPAGIGYLVLQDSDEQMLAQSTGDWVDDEVIQLMDNGHDKFEQGDYEGALAIYQRAREKAPDSSVVNFSLAHAYFELGRNAEALSFVERAARKNPRDLTTAALYTMTLSNLGQQTNPLAQQLLEQTTPRTTDDAYWMASAFYVLEDYEQVLRTAEAGLALDSTHLGFALAKTESLAQLGQADEARSFEATLPEEMTAHPQFVFLDHMLALELDPTNTMRRMTAGWFDEDWAADSMTKLVAAAQRSGQFDRVRAHVRDFLFARSTSSQAWNTARPWFGDEWSAVLDDFLSTRIEFEPGYFRLQEMDPRRESARMVRLARRLGQLDHPEASWADLYYLGALRHEVSASEFDRLAEQHTATKPEHTYCRYTILGYQSVESPAQRWAALEELAASADEDLDLVRALAIDKYEMQMVQGRAAEALAGFEATLPHGGLPYYSKAEIELLAAEAAFHSRETGKMLRHLQEAEAELEEVVAAAHLLRWSAQLASGQGLTYRQDVDQWLEEYRDQAADSASVSAQAILVAEGLRTLPEARRSVAYRSPDTFSLVETIRLAAERGEADIGELSEIASSKRAGDYAPRLARTVVERLRVRSGGTLEAS